MTATLPAKPKIERAPRSTAARNLLVLAGSLAVVLVLVVLSVSIGSRQVTFDEIYAGVTGSAQTIAEVAVAKRVPRTFLALLVGGSLALAGLGMQAVTRNPLADPGIFGISNGASLAVVIGMVFLGTSDPYLQMGLAVVGAAVAAVLVFIIGSAGPGGASPLKLALSGAATAAALASLISIVLLPRVEMLQNYQFWQIGGVGGATWDKVATVAPVLAVATLATWALSRRMNALALGDDMARGLGESVWASRIYIALAAVTLAGVATAVAGPIGFVGLVVPHFCRLITGPDYRMLVPFSMLTGGALLLAADIVGRVVARPQEIQVGILTALIGAPFFVWIVRRQKTREL